jgi:MinD-like ATPase involved in chromosome partitioning or flagellar assembly
LLVTIQGTNRAVEMAVPADIPLGSVMASIVEGCEGAVTGSAAELEGWHLASLEGQILNPRASLIESGIGEGSVLQLRRHQFQDLGPEPEPAGPAEAPEYAPPAAETPTLAEAPPGAPGQAPLPAPIPFGRRLRAVAGALVTIAPDRSHAEPTEEAPASARRLSVKAPMSPIERAQAAWAAGDYLRRLDSVIAAPRLNQCVTIAVVSPKGGVGKTTTSIMLGTLLAMVRSDRVVALDTNPDHGTLGRSLAPEHAVFVDDLLSVVDQPALTVSMLDRFLARAPHGMLVLPAPIEPERMDLLDGDAYQRVIQRLQEMVNILVLDCGAGMRDSVTRTALANADQVVLVSDADPATASLVADVARRMPESASYALVINKLPRHGSRLNLEHLSEDVPGARALIKIEADGEAAARLAVGEFTWETSPAEWQVAVRELAAHLAADWEGLGRTA